MPFETFKRKMIPSSKAPFVTVQRKGTMAFNASAHAALGSPEFIELLYDAERQIIAFKATAEEVEHAYALRPMKGGNTYLVAGRAFTQYYKIDTQIARRYSAFMEDDLLCLDLTGPSTEVTGPRAKPRGEGELPGAAAGFHTIPE